MAESAPLGCAFGLTKDKKECLLLVEKTGSGKKIAAKLKIDGKDLALDLGTVRFGIVNFDLENDPGTVRFTVNRSEAGGTILTLTRLAKKAGYQAIVINVDPGLEDETEQQEGESAGTPQEAGANGPSAAMPGAPPRPAMPGAPPRPAAAGATAPKNAAPDAGALTAELAALIRRIPEADAAGPAVMATLKKLATDANVNIKTNNLTYAAGFIARLREALDGAGAGVGRGASSAPAGPGSPLAAPAQDARAPGEGAVVRLAKGMMLWNGTRGYVDQQVKKLKQAILEQSQGEHDFDEIKASVDNLDTILERLDDRLTERLNRLRGTEDVDAKAAIAAEARRIVAEYQAYAAQDKLMGGIDDNGFIPLDIKARVETTLRAIQQTI
jgi:hypothetical protein